MSSCEMLTPQHVTRECLMQYSLSLSLYIYVLELKTMWFTIIRATQQLAWDFFSSMCHADTILDWVFIVDMDRCDWFLSSDLSICPSALPLASLFSLLVDGVFETLTFVCNKGKSVSVIVQLYWEHVYSVNYDTSLKFND